jgi:hypothetical protein
LFGPKWALTRENGRLFGPRNTPLVHHESLFAKRKAKSLVAALRLG